MAKPARFVDALALLVGCLLAARLSAGGMTPAQAGQAVHAGDKTNGATFVVPVSGTLYVKCVGGSAAGLSQFGLGSSPTSFVSYLSALPSACPTGEIAAGQVRAGQTVQFGIQTWWAGQSYWAFSNGADFGSRVAFTDLNNHLGWDGDVIQTTATNTWVLHLNDAAHYTLTPDEGENLLIQLRLQPATVSRADVPPGVVSMLGPPPPESPTSRMMSVRESLRRATNALEHAANQSCPVVKAIGDIATAAHDVASAITFSSAHTDSTVPPLAAAERPDFTPPDRPAPQRNEMLEQSLVNLKTAYDGLSRTAGGDLGGARAKINADISMAAADLIGAINAANAAFRDGRRDLPPCSTIR